MSNGQLRLARAGSHGAPERERGVDDPPRAGEEVPTRARSVERTGGDPTVAGNALPDLHPSPTVATGTPCPGAQRAVVGPLEMARPPVEGQHRVDDLGEGGVVGGRAVDGPGQDREPAAGVDVEQQVADRRPGVVGQFVSGEALGRVGAPPRGPSGRRYRGPGAQQGKTPRTRARMHSR